MKRAAKGDEATRVVGYVRVSTDKQADRGVSLEAQEAKLRAYAGLYGLQLVEVVVDAGASAKSLDRPGLARALAMLKSGQAEGLLVAKLDRLTRSLRDLGDLVAGAFKTAALLSVAEQVDTRTAGGRLVLNVLGAVSQWEREAVAERTSAALRHKQASGEYIGGEAPYGFGVAGGQLVEDAGEQAVLREAQTLRAAGLSLRRISKALAAQGRLARSGRPLAAEQVRRMLESQSLAKAA